MSEVEPYGMGSPAPDPADARRAELRKLLVPEFSGLDVRGLSEFWEATRTYLETWRHVMPDTVRDVLETYMRDADTASGAAAKREQTQALHQQPTAADHPHASGADRPE